MVDVHGTVTITKGFDTWRTMVEATIMTPLAAPMVNIP